ncbi:MAG: tRNA modification GTPase, partial [Planctomycetota bacterium]
MANASQVTRGMDETIIAISTPRGSGRRGIVRLSGTESIALVEAAFERYPGSVNLAEANWQAIDGRLIVGRAGVSTPVTVYVMRGPRSFTGEDQVELHLPGSPTLLEMVVEVLRRGGARLALAGEFTQRAFLNGRIDLTRAEAVAATIHARSEGERIAALGVLSGNRASQIEKSGDRIAELLAGVELDIDFSDQDIDIVEPDGLSQSLAALAAELEKSSEQPGADRRSMSRRRVLLSGPANAGKSSLFNALAGAEHAIVSGLQGTTRDFLEVEIEVDGMILVIVDTAGDDFHESEVDKEAHRLREREKDLADHVVAVRCGISHEETTNDAAFDTIFLSHADLVPLSARPDFGKRAIWFSSESGEGLDEAR